MPRRRGWDDRWQRYPASTPLPAEGGVATSKQRGPMAETWWSQRFVEVLESYGLGARMQRGRRYARTGQVLTIDVRIAVIAAQVQGSRRTPYVVTISAPEPTAAQWAAIDEAMRAKVGFAARLLAGEVPTELEDVFRAAGVPLFPAAWRDLRSDCSCPDWENPCKHIAAVLYVFADRLDADPWLVLAWRGRTRGQVLGQIEARGDSGRTADEVTPWWPFPPGPLAAHGSAPPDNRARTILDRPDDVLDALEPLDVRIRQTNAVALLRVAYESLTRDEPLTDD